MVMLVILAFDTSSKSNISYCVFCPKLNSLLLEKIVVSVCSERGGDIESNSSFAGSLTKYVTFHAFS